MRRSRKLSVGIALLTLAVVAFAADPVFAQRGGGRPGGWGMRGESGGEGGGRGGFSRPGGGMGSVPGQGAPVGGFRGRGGPPGDSRGRGGPPSGDDRGRSRGPFGGEDGQERFERFLRELDADRDGRVEENEVDGRRRFFVEMMARRAGIEPKFPMSVSRFRDAMARRARENKDDSSSSSGGTKASGDPLVPGFGVEMGLAPVLEFGERAPEDSGGTTRSTSRPRSRTSSSSRGSSSRDSSSGRGEPDERVRRWAEVMMRQADRNHNQRLERDEWNERWGDFREADRNRDGVVKADELARRLGEFSRGGFGRDRGRSEGSSGSGRSGSGSNNSERPKSYRFRTPTEQLPEGLPDWFARKDTNADGQVAMAEFESPGYWTAAVVARFAGYDRNNDGMITPGECLEALSQPEKGSEIAKAEESSQVAQVAGGNPGSGQRPSRGGIFSRLRRPESSGAGRGQPAPPRRESTSGSAASSGGGGVWDGF